MTTRRRFRLVAVCAALAFAAIAAAALAGWTQPLDDATSLTLRRPDDAARLLGPSWLVHVAVALSLLGSLPALVPIVAAASVWLWKRDRDREAMVLLVGSAVGLAAQFLLKQIIGRERPGVVPHLSDTLVDTSFPSGHAMMSAIVYLLLAGTITRSLRSRAARTSVWAAAAALLAMIGLTRVMLGVHYVSDVLAGWIAAVAWIMLCRAFAQPGPVEAERPPQSPPR